MRILSNNRGSVFITVVFIVSMILIMLSLLLTITATETRISQSYADGVKSYYIAKSGLEKAMAYVLKHKEESDNLTVPKVVDTDAFDSTYIKEYSLVWSINYNSSNGMYEIESEGKYGNTVRKLRALINIGYNDKITVYELSQKR